LFACNFTGGEWPVLEHILSNAELRTRLGKGKLVRQLLLEIHLLPGRDEFLKWVALSAPPLSTGLHRFLQKFWLEHSPSAPKFPMTSTQAAADANAHALGMLAQLETLGFALFSYNLNANGPLAAVTQLPTCHELAFVWLPRPAQPAPNRTPGAGPKAAPVPKPTKGPKRAHDPKAAWASAKGARRGGVDRRRSGASPVR